MAWKKGLDHRVIRLRKGYPDPAWHHILAHEVTHIALEADARAVGRNRWFVTTAETRAKAIQLMAPEIKKLARQGHSQDRLAELVVQLHNGATAFVFNCAIDMVIEERLRRELPALADAQMLSLDKLAQEAIGVTSNKEIRKLTPERIRSVNDTLNAATALFVRDLSDGAIDYVAAYKPFHCLQQAERMYATYRKAAAGNIGPGEEYDLVDEFATQLGVRGWYVWRPDAGTGQDATSHVTPAPARRIDSPAALTFLVSALDRLKNLSEAEVKNIATETALKGTTGIDLDASEKIHSISALGNERLSGLELICLMYAAFQRVHAGTDVGVDFSSIWPAAQMMHAARNS